jgi:hypothetical protein
MPTILAINLAIGKHVSRHRNPEPAVRALA